MFEQLKTSADKKRSLALPNTGDHVLGSPIKSSDVAGVEVAITSFTITEIWELNRDNSPDYKT